MQGLPMATQEAGREPVQPESAQTAAARAPPATPEPGAAQPAEGVPGRRRRGQGERYTDIPNSQIRKIIAKRLLESKLNVPHYYLRGHADLSTVTSLRQTLKEQGSKVAGNPPVHCHCTMQ
jgi:pyruvate dehydrogenase E2 component (dihydrolipoamide acetyltransferase)